VGRKTVSASKNQNPKRVAEIIRNAMINKGLRPSEIARKANLDRSHLSKLISDPPTRSLTREQAIALANALEVSQEQLLYAAGYASADDWTLNPNNLALPRRTTGFKVLKVVSDPRFIDAALFMWMFSTQPFRSIGVEIDCELIKADWAQVPETVASNSHCIGFYNRRALKTRAREPLFKVRHWADLSRYQGYALMARQKDCPASPASPARADEYLRALIAQTKPRKPVVVSMGADTVWQLKGILPGLDERSFDVDVYGNADFALRQFLAGIGDLFIGGLPQRFAAQEHGCTNILTGETHPFLFSFNSLICSDNMIHSERAILFSIVSLWYGTVERVLHDQNARDHVATAIPRLLNDLGIDDHNHRKQYFDKVLSPDSRYELFATHPTALLDTLLSSILTTYRSAHYADLTLTLESVVTLLGERIDFNLPSER